MTFQSLLDPWSLSDCSCSMHYLRNTFSFMFEDSWIVSVQVCADFGVCSLASCMRVAVIRWLYVSQYLVWELRALCFSCDISLWHRSTRPSTSVDPCTQNPTQPWCVWRCLECYLQGCDHSQGSSCNPCLVGIYCCVWLAKTLCVYTPWRSPQVLQPQLSYHGWTCWWTRSNIIHCCSA